MCVCRIAKLFVTFSIGYLRGCPTERHSGWPRSSSWETAACSSMVVLWRQSGTTGNLMCIRKITDFYYDLAYFRGCWTYCPQFGCDQLYTTLLYVPRGDFPFIIWSNGNLMDINGRHGSQAVPLCRAPPITRDPLVKSRLVCMCTSSSTWFPIVAAEQPRSAHSTLLSKHMLSQVVPLCRAAHKT